MYLLIKDYYLLEFLTTCGYYSDSLYKFKKRLREFRDGPLEELWGERNFRAAGIFFSLSNSLYKFFLGHSRNIFLGLIGMQEFFFVLCHPTPHKSSNGPSLIFNSHYNLRSRGLEIYSMCTVEPVLSGHPWGMAYMAIHFYIDLAKSYSRK